MYLTCEQVALMSQLEKCRRLQPVAPFVSYFDEYSDYEIYQAINLLHKAYSKENNSLINRLITSFNDSNPIFKRLRKEKKVKPITKLVDLKVLEKKGITLKEHECYGNAWTLTLWGLADKMIAGTSTMPEFNSYSGRLEMATIMHVVAEKNGMILDYNYGIAMEKDEYMKLFAFAPVDEIDHQETVTQYYIGEQHKDKKSTFPYYTTKYYTMANRDFCQKLYGYKRIADEYKVDLSGRNHV